MVPNTVLNMVFEILTIPNKVLNTVLNTVSTRFLRFWAYNTILNTVFIV